MMQFVKGFNTYTSNNGRMQYFKRGQKEAMNLAKNPAGMNVSLSVEINKKKSICYQSE